MDNKTTSGVSFASLLGLLFIALKLTGFVTWSWWLVLLPLYGPALLLTAIWSVVFLAVLVLTLLDRV